MKDNKGNKTGSKSCAACEKPVVNINNEYINETREIIIDGDELAPESDTDLFE